MNAHRFGALAIAALLFGAARPSSAEGLAVDAETLRRTIQANRALARRFLEERDRQLLAPADGTAAEELYARQLALEAKAGALEAENRRLQDILFRHSPEDALKAGATARRWVLTADETVSSR